MKTKLFFLVLFFLPMQFVFAQTKISGIVLDAKDFTPLKGTAVRVINTADSVFVKGTETNEQGVFTVEDLSAGTYNISFSMVGYTTRTKKNIIVAASPVLLDTIKLNPEGYKTEEITVEDEKPIMQYDDEKKVFNIEQMAVAKGGTAIDVLKKIPMIEVDANDNVSLRGSSKVLILIDNKPNKFGSLKQIPADAIKNVEIITNPSAKYEAEGATGIINIVMQAKNPDVTGYNGYLYGGLRSTKGYYTYLSTNLKTGKWSLFGNFGGGLFGFKNNGINNTDYLSSLSRLNVISNGDGTSKFVSFSLGAEYELSTTQALGFESSGNLFSFDNTSLAKSTTTNSSNLITSYYTNNFFMDGKWNEYSGSVYYNGKFDKLGKELNVDLSYTKGDNSNQTDQTVQNYDSLINPVPNPSVQLNDTKENGDNYKLQIDYTHPFNDMTKIETGYKGMYRFNDNDFNSDTLNYSNNHYETNLGLSNRFKLTDFINAFYVTFSQKVGGFKAKLGLRAENTHTKGDLVNSFSGFTKDYLDFFPTVSVSQKLGLVNEFQLSYSRRITRPMIYRLNPFVNRYNSKFIMYGNASLLPEYTDSYELGHSFFSNIISVSTSFFFRRSFDVITNFTFQNDSGYTVTTYKNGAGSKAYGADLIINSSALKWWTVYSSFSFYKTEFEATSASDFQSEQGFAWKANIRSTISVSDLFSVELYYMYSGKRINATGYNDPMQSFDVSLSKKFFNNKLTLSLRAEDLFDTRKWASVTNGVGVNTSNSNKWNSQMFMLNISYMFGNTDKYYQKSKKTKQNENEKQDEKQDNQGR
jgi:outer membrane receptor protein involved in Fe transport